MLIAFNPLHRIFQPDEFRLRFTLPKIQEKPSSY